ncbi:MAG: NADPH-dependent assimilatory sulfite reductase hemoprotein subunit [Firmicutes bacterium]|nr:NADPH-dependent assimilatory sulfite reductase hemoprotein subunit [Bacillota bacterium]
MTDGSQDGNALGPAVGTLLTKVSKVEVIKREGNQLRGQIAAELASDATHFTEDSVQLLKFHGMYQQDDRDERAVRKQAGLERAYSMMIRARIPGGILSADQYLAFDRLADDYGNGTMRITTRQTFQLHGILKGDIQQTLRTLNHVLVTTLGGCGDQVRNILMCPAPRADGLHDQLRPYLMALVDALSAKSRAYHEIWLDGERAPSPDEQEEPFYGATYLPRKFKLALAIEGDNCVDVYANDLGMVAHHQNGQLTGFTLMVGGGMGRTAGKEDTYPRLATPIARIEPAELVEVALAIVGIQRDYGNRSERRYSRFKYLLDERGIDWFCKELYGRLGRVLAPAGPLSWAETSDHLGWHRVGGGQDYLGIHVQNGRVQDTAGTRLKSVLRELVSTWRPTVRMTCDQNILLSGLSETAYDQISRALAQSGIRRAEEISTTVRHAMACVALPTCGLALAESERALPAVLAEVEQIVDRLGLSQEVFSIRMTGCANGCARPYIGDVGFVGRSPGLYDIFLGGDFTGSRLNARYEELVPIGKLATRLYGLLSVFKREREAGEGFGDFCRRVGFEYLRQVTGERM